MARTRAIAGPAIELVVVVLAVVLVVAGCGGSGDTAAPADTGTPGASSDKIGVRVAGIDLTTGTLRYTDAQIFFNEAADQAARADGQPGGAPNRVWVRDLPTGGVLPIDPDASVTLNSWDAEGNRIHRAATVDIFVRVFTAAGPVPDWDNSPWLFVVVEGGRITGIEQPMLP